MSIKQELAEFIREIAVLRGPVTLSSGAAADSYIDMMLVAGDALGSRMILGALADKLHGLDFYCNRWS
jgi:orotate phosphoribosyltransferase